MAHISGVSASIYTYLALSTTVVTNLTAFDTTGEFVTAFATAQTEVTDIREFPQIGTPANIVNVPVFGSPTSLQVQGQADAPNLEFTLNYIPNNWSSTSTLGPLVNNGNMYPFQFSLCAAKPTALTHIVGGLGTVQNSNFFFVARLASLLVSPQLTDAAQATLALAVASPFYGPVTI
jgi:hypothetical protein